MSPILPSPSFDEPIIPPLSFHEIVSEITKNEDEMLEEMDALCIAKLRAIPYVLTRIGIGSCLFLAGLLAWMFL